MPVRIWFLTLTAAFALSSVATAAEPKIGKFVAYQAGKISIVSSRGARQVRDLVEDLADFQLALETTLKRKSAETGIPTHIFILGRREWEKYLRPREGVAGFFLPQRFANYILIDGESDRDSALQIVYHEYTHFFLRSQLSGEYPPWFNEGLAELFSMARFHDGQAEFGVPVGRVLDVRDSQWIPFDRLLAISQTDPEYMSHTLMPGFYGQAWLTVQYGLVEDRQFGAQMLTYINALNRLVPADEAARSSFGADLATTDKKLFEYSRRSKLSAVGIRIAESPPLALSAGQPIGEVDALAMIADLMFTMGVEPARLRLFVDGVAARQPNAPRTLLLEARLADRDDNEAEFERSLASIVPLLGADDWQTRKAMAVVLLNRAEEGGLGRLATAQSNRDFTRAMSLFDEALAHSSQDVESLWGYGSAATRLEQHLELAETRLLAAYKKAPTSADIAMSLAQLYSAKREPDRMIPFLEDTIRFASQLSMRQWAVDTLQQLRQFLARRDQVDAQNKKQREAYEKTRDDNEKKYRKKKK